MSSRGSPACCATSMATTATPRLSRSSVRPSPPASGRCTISPFRPACFRPSSRGSATQVRADGARVVVEKPFGRDLQSARGAGPDAAHGVRRETRSSASIISSARSRSRTCSISAFANSFLEPIWNRNYVHSVQITMAESFGVAGPRPLLREVGAIRDVIQNHLLQIVAILAMECPVSDDSAFVRDEKVKVFNAIRPLSPRRPRSRPISRLPRRAGRRARFQGRDLRRPAAAYRFVALAGRAVPGARRQMPAGDRDRGRVDLDYPPKAVFGADKRTAELSSLPPEPRRRDRARRADQDARRSDDRRADGTQGPASGRATRWTPMSG